MRFDLTVSTAGAMVAISVAFGFGVSHAFASGELEQIRFDIPAQPLATALRAFANATGAFGVYDGKLVADHRSVALKGQFPPGKALATMIERTGLVAEYTSKDAFVIVLPRGDTALQRSTDIASAALLSLSNQEQLYSAHLQQALEAMLCSDPLTRPGDYRAAISVALDSRGTIQRLKLLSSTGDGRRDAAIVAVGSRTSVGEPPPSGMRQPFAMVILPRESGAILQCNAVLGRG